MGSLSSPPPPTQPPSSSPENPITGYRLYAAYCKRKLTPDSNTFTWLEYYDPSNNTWTRLGSIPGLAENHVLKAFAMVTIAESIYVIGGRICRKEGGVHGTDDDDDDVTEVDIQVLPTVSRYDIRNDVWSSCAPLGTPRFDFACTVHDKKIYVAGGQCTLGSARGISSAEMYDPDLDEWTPLPDMSTLRYMCVGVPWQGKIYVVGGFAEKGDSGQTAVPFTIRSSAEVFDTWSGEWDLVVGMWQLDVPPNQIVTVGDRLFSSGDCLMTWKGHIESYDGKLHIWNIVNGSHLPSLSSLMNIHQSDMNTCPVQMLHLTMSPIGTHLYFLAGYRKPAGGGISRFMSVVHRFDTSATGDPWKSFEPMEEEGDKELCSHCCVVHHQLPSAS